MARRLVEVAHFSVVVSASVPQMRVPLPSVSRVLQESKVEMARPCASTMRPARVEVAEVSRRLAESPEVMEVVAEPETVRVSVESVVVVACEPVALVKVKFRKVEEEVRRRLVKVPSPVEVMFPALRIEAKRFVELAVVEKKEVEVALVVVALPEEIRSMRVVMPWSVMERSVVED